MNRKTALLLITLLIAGCGKKGIDTAKEKDRIKSQILNWEYSIKSLDYSRYVGTTLLPDRETGFETEYLDYYYSTVTVMELGVLEDREISNNTYNAVRAEIAGELIARDRNKNMGFMQGTITFVRLSEDSDGPWLIHDKMIIQNSGK